MFIDVHWCSVFLHLPDSICCSLCCCKIGPRPYQDREAEASCHLNISQTLRQFGHLHRTEIKPKHDQVSRSKLVMDCPPHSFNTTDGRMNMKICLDPSSWLESTFDGWEHRCKKVLFKVELSRYILATGSLRVRHQIQPRTALRCSHQRPPEPRWEKWPPKDKGIMILQGDSLPFPLPLHCPSLQKICLSENERYPRNGRWNRENEVVVILIHYFQANPDIFPSVIASRFSQRTAWPSSRSNSVWLMPADAPM